MGESHWLGVFDPFLTSCNWIRHKIRQQPIHVHTSCCLGETRVTSNGKNYAYKNGLENRTTKYIKPITQDSGHTITLKVQYHVSSNNTPGPEASF